MKGKKKKGNILNLHTIPEHAEIVVEAFQPGDREWQPTTTTTCTFRFSKGFVVQKDARVELEGGQVLEELIVYGDARQMGHVRESYAGSKCFRFLS